MSSLVLESNAEVQRSELIEGDHIYVWRPILYSHHGIFVGNNKVIHFLEAAKDEGARSSTPSSSDGGKKKKITCPVSYCGVENKAGSGVEFSCLDCFVQKSKLCRYKYQASAGFLLNKVVYGTCTMAKSDPPQEVIYRATYLHENGYGKYNLIMNNCEDFALYCKTGLFSTSVLHMGRSGQGNVAMFGTLGLGMGLILTKCKDLGARRDVIKVPVHELSSYILSLR